jgi:hypothetical protein
MSLEGVILSFVLLLIVVGLIGAPLLRQGGVRSGSLASRQKQQERLLVYYERVLTNLRDLDEDYVTGKMPEEDYHLEREDWVQRGIQVLKALDTLHATSLISADIADETSLDEAIDAAIEDAIQQFRQQSTE